MAKAATTTAQVVSATGESTGKKKRGPTGPRGPSLFWNDERRLAIARGIALGMSNLPDLVNYLKDAEADVFSGQVSLITPIRVANQIKAMHKAAEAQGKTLAIPESFGGRRRASVNVDALNAALAGTPVAT